MQNHSGKYRPLWEWLRTQTVDELRLSFDEVEQKLGFPLPASSRRHVAHWHSYDGSAVSRAIIDAGWRAHHVDLRRETVILSRSDVQLRSKPEPTARAAGASDDSRNRHFSGDIGPIVSQLGDSTNAVTAAELISLERHLVDGPGLYSWYVDSVGASDLSAGLGDTVQPGLIYVGQTGASR